MIGFAGLGKYLNERGLSLLKGRKKRTPEDYIIDQRLSNSNKTNYDELVEWQSRRRQESKAKRFGYMAFRIFAILLVVFMILFLASSIL